MRLQRGVPVAGLDPKLARAVAQACHQSWTFAEAVAHRCKISVPEAERALAALAAQGFVEQHGGDRNAEAPRPEYADRAYGFADQWTTTLKGGSLTMASFLPPITRRKADQLLAAVLERTRNYNADPAKPLWITRVEVFGSYLDPNIDSLGNLDFGVTFEHRDRRHFDPLEYAHRSGRQFGSMIDELYWPEQEAKQLLRRRSGYINLHTEDLTRFTSDIRVVYEHEGGTNQ